MGQETTSHLREDVSGGLVLADLHVADTQTPLELKVVGVTLDQVLPCLRLLV